MIGTLAATAPMPVDVVTGDRDLFQVVDDDRQVRVLYIARGVGKHEVVDDAWVRAKYGIPAAAYVDYATMRGDASDGLPGVAGIGEKTAASLDQLARRSRGDPGRGQPAREQDQRRGPVQARRRRSTTSRSRRPWSAVARDLELGVDWDDLALPHRAGASGAVRRARPSCSGSGRQRRPGAGGAGR